MEDLRSVVVLSNRIRMSVFWVVLFLLCIVRSTSMSQGGISDASSSAFEPERHAGLVLGFVRRGANADEGVARVAHVDKLGGLPAWPYPPPPQELQAPGCPACSQRMPFVLSVVQPLQPEVERQDCLHVFACARSGCASATNAVRIFRSQRPLPPPADDAHQATLPGCLPTLILREKALHFEEFPDEDGFLEEEEHIQQLLQNYEKESKQEPDTPDAEEAGTGGVDEDMNVEDTNVDKVQVAFSRRIASAPAQVVRYYPRSSDNQASPMDTDDKQNERDALWVCSRGRMSASIPPCAICKGKRRLEMQVMPQVLNFVEVSDQGLGWGERGGGGQRGGGEERGGGGTAASVHASGQMHSMNKSGSSGTGKSGVRRGGPKYDTLQLQMDMDWGTIGKPNSTKLN